ncbi:CLUMA_CG017572, isoform A [Clunio marinus]|uniref:CLUMA_CG017572, isoform A n=1 Tax=Clunio marinus TaxID=568069 RepID=A0A1J1IW35_9DIPT|nr:CLUMA_CG017572, isoform A [Clunio marinus]
MANLRCINTCTSQLRHAMQCKDLSAAMFKYSFMLTWISVNEHIKTIHKRQLVSMNQLKMKCAEDFTLEVRFPLKQYKVSKNPKNSRKTLRDDDDINI